ncbi:MAG: hypothetical protein HYZ28_27115 [Myxococcales bacterium]|nr:hypothetical protein [Myxococcales bacterium]
MLPTALLVPLLAAVPFAPAYSQKIDSPGGELRLGVGQLSEPLQGRLPEAVRAFALSRREELGLPATSGLGAPEVFGTRFGASFHLRQQVSGLDVHGARVVVTIDRSRSVVQLSSGIVRYRRAALDWRMSPREAMRLAARAVPMALLDGNGQPYGGVRQEVFPSGEVVHSGYLVWVLTLDPSESWHVAVDSVAGEVLWAKNRVFRASDDANVYSSSPGGLDAGVGAMPLVQVQLRHADGGSMLSPVAFLPLPDGGGYFEPNDAGRLYGNQLTTFGCCPNQGCSEEVDAGPKRARGVFQMFGFNINYDVAVCDRVMRAANDPALNDGGSYVFTPFDPPTGPVSQSQPTDSDPFAEVHAFYHLNSVYDFVRGLSSAAAPIFPGENLQPFRMRDEKRTPPRTPASWANVTLPDVEDMQKNINPQTQTATTNKLMRVDNAMFLARENFQQLILPAEYALDVDTLMMFQGTKADFAYDAPVLWHEFGHGVIASTADFSAFVIDARSGNDEGGALHEGIADYLAAALGQNPKLGEYVGPRISDPSGGGQLQQDISLRDLENSFSCPEVLWGEVHQDSQHFSAALWQARKSHFLGADNGRTFDAAIYAALVSMNPRTDFDQAAAAIAAHLPAAFPQVPQADSKMKQIFDARGVTNCSKLIDLTVATQPRPYYGIGGTQRAELAAGQLVPGPYQLKLITPNGAKSVTIAGQVGGGLAGFGGAPQVKVLAKVGQPITFTRPSANTTAHDADKTADATITGGSMSGKVAIQVPCGASSEIYLTLATPSANGATVRGLSASFEQADSCGVPDAGSPGTPDAGRTVVVSLAPQGGRIPEGCGCSSSGAGLAALALASALLRRRRR